MKATLNKGGADFIIISTLTDYIARKNFFDKSSVESVVEDFKAIIPSAVLIIKSTVPVRFTATSSKNWCVIINFSVLSFYVKPKVIL